MIQVLIWLLGLKRFSLESKLHNYRLKLAYNGAPFCGFARQPGQLTVQGNLETALRTALRQEVETTCAGRTDAGVHARAQFVNFLVEDEGLANKSFLRSLNALTHENISVLEVDEVEEDFSARFSAKMREYRYFICNNPTPPIFAKDFSWHVAKPLDAYAMTKASQCLIGEHDFKSFCMAVSAVDKTTMRYVDEISFSTDVAFGEELLVIKVVGNAFLHSMVRTIVGTLDKVGSGKRQPSWVAEDLDAKDRRAAGENAPAQGLVFWDVRY